MNQIPLQFLFRIHNRRGLGHLVRGINIAREIRLLAPCADILFSLINGFAKDLFGDEFRFIANDPVLEDLRNFRPDVVVYDTLMPQEVHLSSARSVYIMRKCTTAKQQEIFHAQFLDRVDLILIPHVESEFNGDFPEAFHRKSHFVGPIVRRLSKEIQTKLRENYHIRPEDFLLVSTPGGGGFESSQFFFRVVFGVHARLFHTVKNLHHIVVQGPNSPAKLSSVEGMTVVPFEPALGNLFAISDLVIAEGGYNTVHEIRSAKKPAVFLPAQRNYDDQEERVRSLERSGLCLVVAGDSAESISEKIASICRNADWMNQVKSRYETDQMETGNVLAAEKIIGLVSE